MHDIIGATTAAAAVEVRACRRSSPPGFRSHHRSCRRRVRFSFRPSSASSRGRLRLARCDPGGSSRSASDRRSGDKLLAPVAERVRKVVATDRRESRDVVVDVVDVQRHKLPIETIDGGELIEQHARSPRSCRSDQIATRCTGALEVVIDGSVVGADAAVAAVYKNRTGNSTTLVTRRTPRPASTLGVRISSTAPSPASRIDPSEAPCAQVSDRMPAK